MGYEISFLGLLISLIFVGFTGIHPGGIIVPSYLVLFVHYPLRVVATLAAALLTLLCYRLACRYLILFGTRRFAFMILVAAIWTLVWVRFFPALLPGAPEFRVIGWVVPGLIANNFERQGIGLTTASLITATVSTYLLGQALHALNWV
jgi:gamma-polyglutamate biosynthesis protein CapC